MDRSAVLIIGGIDCQLIIERNAYAFESLTIIVRLNHIFGTVMGQFAIPDQNSEPPIIEEPFLRVTETVQRPVRSRATSLEER